MRHKSKTKTTTT